MNHVSKVSITKLVRSHLTEGRTEPSKASRYAKQLARRVGRGRMAAMPHAA